jgi:NADPH:quinone reductase-like Zn-dependent oxidoreductase
MKAMVLNKICSLEGNKNPLETSDVPDPAPGEKEILVKVYGWSLSHPANILINWD